MRIIKLGVKIGVTVWVSLATISVLSIAEKIVKKVIRGRLNDSNYTTVPPRKEEG